mmetsp:Transcript_22465/g.28705  ORF Transcript_22465/g.28705 Transcript_22465/m.28705 type:complete len:191 (-) Transcript_22465:261-833(-)
MVVKTFTYTKSSRILHIREDDCEHECVTKCLPKDVNPQPAWLPFSVLKTCVFSAVVAVVLNGIVEDRYPLAALLVPVLLLTSFFVVPGYLERLRIREEQVIIIPGVGVQLAQVFATGITAEHFYDIGRIRSLIICEEVTTFGVYCYLALIIKLPLEEQHGSKTEMLVDCFPSTRPRLSVLKEIYQRCVFL